MRALAARATVLALLFRLAATERTPAGSQYTVD